MNKKEPLKIIYGNKSSKTNHTIWVREEDFEVPHGEDYKIAIQELEKIQQSLYEGKPLVEQFVYKDVSLWWFIYQSLVPYYKKTTNFVRKFSDFLENTNPNNIQVRNFERLDLIKKICIKKGIKCTYSKSLYLKFLLKQKSKESIKKKRFEQITKKKIRTRINLFLQKSIHIPELENKIIFVVPTNYRRQIFNSSIGKTQEGEYIQQSIINLLKQDNILGVDIDYTFQGDLQILSNRLKETLPWFPVEMLLAEKNSIEHQRFLDKYNKLILSYNFKKIFTFNDVYIWDEIKKVFKEMEYFPHLPLYLNLIDSITNHFKENTPKAIFLPYETGPIALAFIAACKKLGIITIGIQHGYIYEFNPMYSFGNSLDSNQNYGFSLPDYLLLFGNYVKNLLVKNGYPENKLLVFGNPAFFGLDKILKNFDKSYIKDKLGIKNNKKIILFTSGKLQRFYLSHGKYDYDEQIWKYLVQKFGKNENFFLILKPHPQEQNTKVYQEIMEKYGSTNSIISYESIYDLICLSDIVVSVFSSTMLDSLCFKKPVIRVRFGDEKHQIFDNTKALITSDLEDLSNHIISILNNNMILNNLKNQILEFVKDQYGIPEENPKEKLKDILQEDVCN